MEMNYKRVQTNLRLMQWFLKIPPVFWHKTCFPLTTVQCVRSIKNCNKIPTSYQGLWFPLKIWKCSHFSLKKSLNFKFQKLFQKRSSSLSCVILVYTILHFTPWVGYYAIDSSKGIMLPLPLERVWKTNRLKVKSFRGNVQSIIIICCKDDHHDINQSEIMSEGMGLILWYSNWLTRSNVSITYLFSK